MSSVEFSTRFFKSSTTEPLFLGKSMADGARFQEVKKIEDKIFSEIQHHNAIAEQRHAEFDQKFAMLLEMMEGLQRRWNRDEGVSSVTISGLARTEVRSPGYTAVARLNKSDFSIYEEQDKLLQSSAEISSKKMTTSTTHANCSTECQNYPRSYSVSQSPHLELHYEVEQKVQEIEPNSLGGKVQELTVGAFVNVAAHSGSNSEEAAVTHKPGALDALCQLISFQENGKQQSLVDGGDGEEVKVKILVEGDGFSKEEVVPWVSHFLTHTWTSSRCSDGADCGLINMVCHSTSMIVGSRGWSLNFQKWIRLVDVDANGGLLMVVVRDHIIASTPWREGVNCRVIWKAEDITTRHSTIQKSGQG